MQIPPHWHVTQLGEGIVQSGDDGLELSVPSGTSYLYHDAQVCDYAIDQPQFIHRPPLHLTVTAKAEGDIQGTAGFGFWNHPFMPGQRRFRLPQAVWFFFGSPPHDIALARGLAGHGWKAATFDAQRPLFYGLLPLAPLGFLLMRSQRLYNALWEIGQSAIGVSEAQLAPSLLDDFHTYTIDWRTEGVTFAVDGQTVLHSSHAPTKPLGFIAWVDNQYAIVTPQGRFGWGLLDVPAPQKLILQDVTLTTPQHPGGIY